MTTITREPFAYWPATQSFVPLDEIDEALTAGMSPSYKTILVTSFDEAGLPLRWIDPADYSPEPARAAFRSIEHHTGYYTTLSCIASAAANLDDGHATVAISAAAWATLHHDTIEHIGYATWYAMLFANIIDED